MLVSLKDSPDKQYVVYAVYWGTNFKTYQRYHYVIQPEEGVDGFSSLGEDEVNVDDNSLDNYTLVKQEPGIGDILVHNAALPMEGLFDCLSENGHPEKVEQLFQNMRDMGLEPY